MSTIILACTTMLEAVAAAQEKNGTSYAVIELDRNYHVDPAKMREHILTKLSELPDEVDTVLVAMGFCGGSWQDVSSNKRIVMPKVSDCVAMMLVTPERYSPDMKEMGHMYLFGDGDSGFSIHAVYEELRKDHDKEMADIVFDMYFEHYYHLDIIDNGLYDCYDTAYVEKAQEDADRIEAELHFTEGSNTILEQLVSGQWDERFSIFEAGKRITQSAFYDI